MLPALAIFASVFGPQRTWLVFLPIGLVELLAGALVVRRNKSSVLGWLAVVVGVVVFAVGIRLGFGSP
jgi:hypothetical protein